MKIIVIVLSLLFLSESAFSGMCFSQPKVSDSDAPASNMNFNDLPDEMIFQVLDHLSPNEVVQILRTSKRFHLQVFKDYLKNRRERAFDYYQTHSQIYQSISNNEWVINHPGALPYETCGIVECLDGYKPRGPCSILCGLGCFSVDILSSGNTVHHYLQCEAPSLGLRYKIPVTLSNKYTVGPMGLKLGFQTHDTLGRNTDQGPERDQELQGMNGRLLKEVFGFYKGASVGGAFFMGCTYQRAYHQGVTATSVLMAFPLCLSLDAGFLVYRVFPKNLSEADLQLRFVQIKPAEKI